MKINKSEYKYKSVSDDLVATGRSIIWSVIGFCLVLLILIGFIISEVMF